MTSPSPLKRSRSNAEEEEEEINPNKKQAIYAESVRHNKPHRSSIFKKVTKKRHRDLLPEVSDKFKKKTIDYVFFIVSHGGGVDQGDRTVHFPGQNPPFGFSSNCDVIFQSSYGMCSNVAHCDAIIQNFSTPSKLKSLSGARLIESLNIESLFQERKFRQYDEYTVNEGLVPNHYIFTSGNIYDDDCIIIYDVKNHTFLTDDKGNANVMRNNDALLSLKLKKRKQIKTRKRKYRRATHRYKKSTYMTMDEREPTLFDLCNAHTGTLRQLNFAKKDFSKSEIAFVVGACRVIGPQHRAHYSPTSWSTVSSVGIQGSESGDGVFSRDDVGLFTPHVDGDAAATLMTDKSLFHRLGTDDLRDLHHHTDIFNAPFQPDVHSHDHDPAGGKRKPPRKLNNATKKRRNRK